MGLGRFISTAFKHRCMHQRWFPSRFSGPYHLTLHPPQRTSLETVKELSSVIYMQHQESFFKCSILCPPLIYDLPFFTLVNLHLRWTACAVTFLQTSFLNPHHSVSDLEPVHRSGINEAARFLRFSGKFKECVGSNCSDSSRRHQRGGPASGCSGTLYLLGVSELKQSDDKFMGSPWFSGTKQHNTMQDAQLWDKPSLCSLSLSDTHTRAHARQPHPFLHS